MTDYVWLGAQLVGVVFLAFFLRGVYLIYKSEEGKIEQARAQIAEREGRVYTDKNEYHRRTVTEAEGRVFLIRRKFWDAVDRVRGWRPW